MIIRSGPLLFRRLAERGRRSLPDRGGRGTHDDRTVVRRLLQLYHYDFSEFEQLTNPAATSFWRKAIRYRFQEHEQGTEIVQSFTADL